MAIYSYDDLLEIYAYHQNHLRIVATQGEGTDKLTSQLTDNDLLKAPRFQLCDERGVLSIPTSGNPRVQLAVKKQNGAEDLLDCIISDASNGIVTCPIRKSLTDVPGEVEGEIRLITANAVIKFTGIDFFIYEGVSDSAAVQSSQFSDLILALQQVSAIITGGSSGTISLDTIIQHNGTNPVASGLIYDYLVGDYSTYLRGRFTSFKYAHEAHSSNYDAETNPVDTYNDTTFDGVYIDEATDMKTCYIIKNSNSATVGLLISVAANNNPSNGVTQIALYYTGRLQMRRKHGSTGLWDESWTAIESQGNKDMYNSEDDTYFGISNDDTKYPSSKAIYKFIQSNAQTIVDIYNSIKDSVLLGYDTLIIDKEYSIHKNLVETYLNNSDYSEDTDYTVSALDDFDFEYETHGRPNKVAVTIPTGGVAIKYRDTVTGIEWVEPTESTTYIQNLIPNHIYVYQFLDSNNTVLKTGTAKASGQVRMINAGGDTYNIRDLGGWAADGGKLKYGVIYRGAELNDNISITETQRLFFKQALQIRDEIDLRSSADGGGSLGVGVDYANIVVQYSPYAFNDTYKTDTAKVIKRIAKNLKDNKPTYIHCQAGADRTGVICLLLEAICGVSKNDIDRDYELTSFSKQHDNTRITRKRNSTWANGLKPMVALIEEMEGNSFKEKVVRFLLRSGVTIDEINNIRYGLIDGNPSKLASPYTTANITYSLTNMTVYNNPSTTTLYQSFETEIVANNNCATPSVTVSMGGNNITTSCYKNGRISIPIVTGNIVITGSASNQIVVFTSTLTSIGWNNNQQTISVPSGYIANGDVIADTDISSLTYNQLCADGCGGIYIDSVTNGNVLTLTAHALGNTPTADIDIQVTLTAITNLDD